MKNKTYELLYDTQAQFNQAQGSSGNVTSITPGVAYVVENSKMGFNDNLLNFIVIYKVDDVSSPTKIYGSDNSASAITVNLKEIVVDKTHIPASSVTNTYQFQEVGYHKIIFRYTKFTQIPNGGAFKSCTNIVYAKPPKTITKIGTGAFEECSNLKNFVFPENCKTVDMTAFRNCSKLDMDAGFVSNFTYLASMSFEGCRKLHGDVTFNPNVTLPARHQFNNCSGITSVHFPSGFSSGIPEYLFRNTSVSKVYSPRLEDWLGYNHSGDNWVSSHFDLYFGESIVTSVTIPGNITSIQKEAFFYCKSLSAITIPETVTNIGVRAFANCPKLVDLTIPSSATLANGQLDIRKTGNYTGTMKCLSTTSLSFNVQVTPGQFKNYYFAGDVVSSGTSLLAYRAPVTIRIKGNFSSNHRNGVNYCYTDESILRFLELGGQFIPLTSDAILSGGGSSYLANGCLLHLGYDGIACTPAQCTASSSRLAKIYVGDGSSQAHDQAILDQYLADENWTPYASKLDLWYNYHGEYRQE